MTTYIFLPVPTQEMKNFANNLRLGAENTLSNLFVSGAGKGFMRFFGGCLNGLNAWDELMVIMHASQEGGSTIAGARRRPGKGGAKVYSPEQLAEVMEAEGLPKSFINVKMLVCGSALKCSTAEAPYAEMVFRALRSAGYSRIRVTGYLGNVATDKGKIQVLRNGIQGGKYYDGDIPGSYKVYQ